MGIIIGTARWRWPTRWRMIETKKWAKITNYGEYLEKFPPVWEVQIHENTAWSCVHGVERWRSNCGCNAGRPGWNQNWRKPLREALDWLRDALRRISKRLAQRCCAIPGRRATATSTSCLTVHPEVRERFGREHFLRDLTAGAAGDSVEADGTAAPRHADVHKLRLVL